MFREAIDMREVCTWIEFGSDEQCGLPAVNYLERVDGSRLYLALCSLDCLEQERICLWDFDTNDTICGKPAVGIVECWDSNGDGSIRHIPVCVAHGTWVSNYD
jgi:hypothetical protein